MQNVDHDSEVGKTSCIENSVSSLIMCTQEAIIRLCLSKVSKVRSILAVIFLKWKRKSFWLGKITVAINCWLKSMITAIMFN